jgi:hypothetical protein
LNKFSDDGYSANVQIHLHVQGHKLQVARIRGGVLTLRDRCDVEPSSEAKIVISVDGREDVLPVVLSKGIDSRSDVVEFF